jgi:DNA-binding MarR family transcriptional regulator/GNAT superfamily N-acetyltransferase
MSLELNEQIADVRSFNRFYTRQIGLLHEGLLSSPFTLTEVRVLYELALREGWTASELGRFLGLDPGYLSRILKRFTSQGLVRRLPSPVDGRQSLLALTTAGYAAFEPLNLASQAEVGAMLERLSAQERADLISAMETVTQVLDRTAGSSAPWILRRHRSGDLGWIVHRQALLYAQEYGWDEAYEALAAEILAKFIRDFDPEAEHSWIAERNGIVVGSVFLVRDSAQRARLRLLYVEPSARGSGLGRRLVDECIQFARAKGYRTLTLWTNHVLVAARRLYEAAGFRLIDEAPHHSFGHDLIGQNWDLDLGAADRSAADR